PDGTFDSSPNFNPLIAPGGKFSHTFTQAGGFPYYCSLHPNMIGTVIVAGIEVSKQTAGISNNQTAGGRFTIIGMDEVGKTYNITGISQNAIGKSFSINSGKSVEIQFNGTGEVELLLPKDLISNVTAVLSGNETIQHETLDENTTTTTISFEIPNGRTAIDIMGGFVVPEFSGISAILAGAIVVVIGVLKIAGNKLGLVGRI
ncbi:MAG TPA: plastocyanin/azurin family copper-binding protein, partial [Nitrososphaera sp.]